MSKFLEKLVDKLENRVPINEIHKRNKFEKFLYKTSNTLGFKRSIYTFKKECSFCNKKLSNDTVVSVVIEKKHNVSFIKHEELHKCPDCKQHWEYDNYTNKELEYKNIQ